MSNVDHDEPDVDSIVQVSLEGGPEDLERPVTLPCSLATQMRIKIAHRGGYEHFEINPSTAETRPVSFRWMMRTKIAE